MQQDEADTLVRAAFDAGLNFIDTANVYAGGESERILGQAIRNLGIPRDDVVIATKVLGPMGDGPNARGASRAHIMAQAKASLSRLQIDYIDLYQIHGFDPVTPIVETLEALDTLVRQGHVRYIGLSNWAAWQIVKAIGITDARKLAPILSLQAYYTLVGRDLEREIAPMLRAEGLGLMVWSPLAGGFLSGKYSGGTTANDGRRASFNFPPVDLARGDAAIAVMRGIASGKDCTVAQVALAWLLHQPAVTSVIVGAKRIEQLQDNIRSTEVALSAEDLAALDSVTKLPPNIQAGCWSASRNTGHRLPRKRADMLSTSRHSYGGAFFSLSRPERSRRQAR